MGVDSRKSKERVLFGNFAALSILKVYNLIIPFVTLPYLIKILDFSTYGVIVLSLSLNQYFHTFTTYGFNYTATRDIARHRHSENQLSYIYIKYLSATLLLLCISLIFYFVVINLVPSFKGNLLIFSLSAIVLVGNSLFPEWFFRGVEKMYFITILDVSVKTILTVGVFVFIHEEADSW
ncbi:oligosaccharide flippase family protein, partial [Vibrio sp. RM-41-2A]